MSVVMFFMPTGQQATGSPDLGIHSGFTGVWGYG